MRSPSTVARSSACHCCPEGSITGWGAAVSSSGPQLMAAGGRAIAAGHAFVQNLRRGHYDIVADEPLVDRVRLAFAELAPCL